MGQSKNNEPLWIKKLIKENDTSFRKNEDVLDMFSSSEVLKITPTFIVEIETEGLGVFPKPIQVTLDKEVLVDAIQASNKKLAKTNSKLYKRFSKL